jgi:hypothetical protein
MTASEPPHEDNPELLAAALDHTWAWYDGRTSRALQVVGFYLVAAAITGSAYTSALTNKDYGIALAAAIFGLVLTAVASTAGLREVNAAAEAERPLALLQHRVSRTLGIDICMTISDASPRQRRTGIIIVIIGSAFLVNIGSLLYALIY